MRRSSLRGTLDEAMRVLVVEDDHEYADVVVQMLQRNPELTLDVQHVPSMEQAEAYLEEHHDDLDVVLLDLNLPDVSGLRTVKRFVDEAPELAVVVMTARREQQLGVEAIQLGAKEYVVKDDLTPQLVLRTLRYAYERQLLTARLQEAERQAERERELRRLERLATTDQGVPETARMYGHSSVRVQVAQRYDELITEYLRILDDALTARVYKTSSPVNEDLRSLAGVLGVLRARPRDVIELHTDAMRQRMQVTNVTLSQAYIEEGRLLLLELMGHVAAYYRARSVEDRRDTVADVTGREEP